MSNSLHITDDLLVKYMLGEALPAEVSAVQEWMHATEENDRYYSQLKQVWEQSLELAPVIQIDEKEAWQRFKKRIEDKPAQNNAGVVPIRSNFIKRMMAAAAIIILAVAGWLLLGKPAEQPAIAMLEKKTTLQTAVDTLPDGSVITLNKNTQLSYPEKFSGKTRNVKLKGEAFFSVKPDKAKPFIIHANDVTITVVGTSFNVKNYDSSTQVIVESGIVRISYHNKIIELVKGEQVMIKNNEPDFEKQKTRDSLYNYYRSNAIICNATPLPDVAATLNEAYNVNITLEDASLRQLQLSTTFKDEDIDTIISIIQQTFDLRVVKDGSNYFLYSK